MKGKPWPVEKERQLRELVASGADAGKIAAALGKTRDAILKKAQRLGLEVVGATKFSPTTTSKLELNAELISIEEALKMLNAALKALDKPGLDKAETLRLRTIIQGVKTYKELFADYVNYRGLEFELLDLREKYAGLAEKSKGASAQ